MINYKVISLIDENISIEDIKVIINNKLYKVIKILELR